MAENTNRMQLWLEMLHEEHSCNVNDELLHSLETLSEMSWLYSDNEIGMRLQLLEERYCS